MASIFTQIIAGEIPGRFVYQDDRAVVFLDAFPQTDGHLLVVPREEIDRWTDLPADLAAHLFAIAHRIAPVLREEIGCERIGVVIEGFAVPHTHIHLFPANSPADFDSAHPSGATDGSVQDEMCARIRTALRNAGMGEYVPN
ncbi:MAG: HIT family protein [Bowdeniella nasicola]|nr:HIT family protein [Bowdeniella nasicola]